MTSYLLHQRRDGTPVGIFTEQDYLYEALDKSHEAYGVSVVESRGPDTEWSDWIEQLASKTPSPRAMWDIYEHDDDTLENVLQEARDDMTTTGG